MHQAVFVIPEEMQFITFESTITSLLSQDYRPLVFCGNPQHQIICLLLNDKLSVFKLLCTTFPEGNTYPSITVKHPCFHMFERELWEEYDIVPKGHPWLKGVRFPEDKPEHKLADYPFFNSKSTAIHEVAVGPVHAGVIEPGHFRFLCEGEAVHHLEIQLGYQHRGVCKLMEKGDLRDKVSLAEAIAGDTAIGHALAYCSLVEALTDTSVEAEIKVIRAIALELERIGMHLADLSALAGDIAYLSGQNFFAALRTTVINTSLLVCGSRYGKRWLKPGGVNYHISPSLRDKILANLADVQIQVNNTAAAMFGDSGVSSRFDFTGIVPLETVQDLGITGFTARASGLARDMRATFNVDAYKGFVPKTLEWGDVYSRAYLRYLEINQSIDMCFHWLKGLPCVDYPTAEIGEIKKNCYAVGIAEGWRGEIIHLAQIDTLGKTLMYKIYDPSFHNWTALAMSVRNNGISDFPVCNKSFNLSYCGFDL
jgi:Ni,Fe-hydrogenase III large subunit